MSYNQETNMYEGYIYIISNDIYPEKLYVGQTSSELITRWRGHVSQINDHSSTDMLHNAMKKYGVEHYGMDGIEKCEAPTKNELIDKLNNREKYYITLFDSFYNGYNLTKGGRDARDHQMRAVKRYDINGAYQYTYESIDSLKNEFENVSTIYYCCNGKTKYAYGHIWRYLDDDLNIFPLPDDNDKKEAMIRYYSLLEIDKYNYRGELVCTYKNASDAAENERVKRKDIVNCCIERKIYIDFFTYRFHHENFNTYKTFKDKPKFVEQYDLQGNFINVFLSVRKAAKAINGKYQSIAEVCNHKMKSAYGYIWNYVENDLIIPDFEHTRHCKTVYKYNKKCELVYIYKSITDAAKDNNVCIETIINSCKERKSNYGSEYTYSYTELTTDQIKKRFRNPNGKTVYMYSLDNKFLKTFDSCVQAGKFIGKKHAGVLISSCCLNKKKTAYGYKWKYEKLKEIA